MKIRYKERILGISSDTAFNPELIDWLSPSDMILHETNHGEAHTSYKKLEAYVSARSLLKEKIYLYHLSDLFNIKESKLKILERGRLYEIRKL